MLVTLDTPYVDTTVADLSFALDLDEQPALEVLELADPLGPGTRLQLRLLGASHQIVLDAPAGRLVETVACLPGRVPGLPGETTEERPGLRYRFRTTVHRSPRLVAEFAADVRAAPTRALTLTGVFPGDPAGVTSLSADLSAPNGVSWRTVHAYPGTGELVVTRTGVWRR